MNTRDKLTSPLCSRFACLRVFDSSGPDRQRRYIGADSLLGPRVAEDGERRGELLHDGVPARRRP